ncbi:ATP-binding protein [Altererythrobacter arenosus]|uniref:ATP-binding protein n=1 Tax=Altererythrobacter arenosus TaxID=3032592 RepID=A0ABY8FVF0_9SPHN|nr:ATP-binding protein [Altererythrobacter sp. CAU 1644]WFL78065.1 ATP-binding protein [Altererythrobacter sp. CAU 1644]
MKTRITIGHEASGKPVEFDVEELLATRLLVQGNSGSGKSHLLRRLLEESAGMVQQVVIDPEGDFPSLAKEFGHVVIDGAAYAPAEIEALARRIREHRASVVLDLDGLEVEQQIRCAAQFLTALFDAPREHWYPALVVVDEAQMFAPAVAGEIAEDTRRMTLSAMTNLMCRGRKRGLAGIVATQRLAKLAKNVAAEASNFLMGRTFLDIDMVRAADLLGMERRQAERIRELERGHFLALGPAITRLPLAVKIGPVRSGMKARAEGLMALPETAPADMAALLTTGLASEAAKAAPPPPPPPAPRIEEVEESIAAAEERHAPQPGASIGTSAVGEQIEAIIGDLAQVDGIAFQSASAQYQTFLTRCRRERLIGPMPDMQAFKRRFAVAGAGLDGLAENIQDQIMQLSEGVEEDLLAPFLVIAKAAHAGETQVDEDALARAYGTASPGRIRRLLDHLERQGLIVVREDFGGTRTVLVPGLAGEPAE